MESRLSGVLRAERRKISAATHDALHALGRTRGHRRTRPAPGTQPHSVAIPADAPAPRIEWTRYTRDAIEEKVVADVAELRGCLGGEAVDWIHVQGFGDEAQLRALAEVVGIHPLALADIVNIPQRAKFDDYGSHQLIVLCAARSIDGAIELRQLSLAMADGCVVTFDEHPGDVFQAVRARLHSNESMIRRGGSDFLAYALIDSVVDGFFPVLDTLSDALEELEEAAIGDPEPRTLARIQGVRRLLIHLIRSQRQQRDALLALSRLQDGPFDESVRPYLRDVQDHAIHVLDTIETLRETTVGVMDIYLSSVSNRTNEVMKTLTVMASLFIPLTFITGVYGMNFDQMPELHWRWGYAFAWGVIVGVAAVLLAWFGWRGWLGAFRKSDRWTSVERTAARLRGGEDLGDRR